MSASRQQNALSPLQKMEDPSGTAMPTLGQHPSREEPRFVPESTSPEKPSPQKHADPPAFPPAVPSMRFDSTPVEGDHPLVQEGPRSISLHFYTWCLASLHRVEFVKREQHRHDVDQS